MASSETYMSASEKLLKNFIKKKYSNPTDKKLNSAKKQLMILLDF